MKNQSYEHRKAKRVVYVKDVSGTPVANQRLQLKQTNHEFLFGCGAFDMVAYTNPKEGMDLSILQDRVDKWLALFNYGTLPFYLGAYEPVEGSPQQESRMNAAKFLQKNNIAVKGHPLCWHTAWANWLMQYDNKTILDKILKRIDRDVKAFTGTIDMWDVINEVVIMPIFDKYDNAVTRVCKEIGRVGIIKETFGAARAANPDATLLLNDFNTSESYADLINDCLEAGVPIDVIGIQSHQHQGYWGAEKLYQVLERFERFGKTIHFTENTFVSGDLIPAHIVDLNDFQVPEWPSTPEGELRQADEAEEMYRILFSHPLVEAITNWDYTDGMWLKAPSGMLHKDNTIKPVYERLMKLIKGEWWTECEVCTDENGRVELEGFKGDYVLELNKRCTKVKITSGMNESVIVL